MKNKILKYMHQAILTITLFIKQECQNYSKKREQELAIRNEKILQEQKKNEKEYFYNLMCDIQEALFSVMHNHEYNNIHIKYPADIRILNYRIIKNKPYFIFSIEKSNSLLWDESMSGSLQNNINRDILRHRHVLIRQYGEPNVKWKFPYLYYGVTIIKIVDYGLELKLAVESNFLP